MTSLKRTALLCSLALTFAISGCATTASTTNSIEDTTDAATEQTKEIVEVEEAVEADTATESVSAASNYAPPSVQITDSGVSSLTTSTAPSLENIQSAFPDMEITTETMMAEGMEYPLIVVRDGAERIAEIEPTMDESGIYRLTAMGSQFSSVSDVRIGDSYSSIYAETAPDNCYPGVDDIANSVSCSAPDSEKVRYIFEGDWPILYGQLPSDAELANGRLTAFFWIPGNY